MNFSTLKTRLLLNAGNMQSTHPLASYAGQYVNDGNRFMVARASRNYPNYQLFPEHSDYYWTPSVTVADTNTVALPSDSLVVQRVYSADSSTLPNLNNQQWRLLSYSDPEDFDQMSRPTTMTSYPVLWTQRKGNIELWPTPRTGKTTYIKMDGIDDEPDMTNATDVPRVNARWHPAIIDCASHLICNDMGWVEDAQRFLDAADQKIAMVGASLVGLRAANFKRCAYVSGAPR